MGLSHLKAAQSQSSAAACGHGHLLEGAKASHGSAVTSPDGNRRTDAITCTWVLGNGHQLMVALKLQIKDTVVESENTQDPKTIQFNIFIFQMRPQDK